VTPLGGRRLAGNAALNLLGQGLPLLAAIPAVPILIQGAGTERFGLLTIAWVLIGYLGLFDFGLGRALTHSVAERVGRGREGEIRQTVKFGVRIAGLLSLVAGLVVVLAAPWLAGILRLQGELAAEAVSGVRVVGLAVPLVVLGTVLRGVLEGLHRFGLVNAVRIPMGVATFVAPLVVLPWSDHLGALIGALAAARLMGWVGYAWAVRRVLAEPRFEAAPGEEGSPGRALLRYGGWATVSNLVSPLMVQFDRVVIAALLSASAVAYYTTPFEIVHRLMIIPGAVVGAFFPAFAQEWGAGQDSGGRLFRGSVEGILALVLPAALVLFAFAGEGLELWVGADFAREGAPVARWLLVGMLFNAAAHVPFVLVQAKGRPDLTARIHLLEVPVYAGVLIWILPRYGIVGAAVVWTGRVALDLLLLLGATVRLAPGLKGEAARSLGILGVCLALLVVPVALPDPWVRAAWVATVGTAVVLIGWRRLQQLSRGADVGGAA
jgi:O-antigen/teichoic acid export membrane protein